jgi:vacuolar-type H+-ATPase subunit H
MAASGNTTTSTGVADSAINQVLKAEQKAREVIAQRRSEAAQRVTDARLRARRIEERADARVSKLRAACQQWTGGQSAKLLAEAEELRSCPAVDEVRRARLDDAIRRLAAELTGGGG